MGVRLSQPLRTALTDAVRWRTERGWPAADAAEAALAAATGAPGETSGDTGHEDRLADLATRFGLQPVESLLLEAVAAAEQSSALHLLSGLLSGDQTPARPTVVLALELAGLPPTDVQAHRHFADLAPLVRLGLVELAGTDVLLARRVRVPDRVAAHLAGGDLPDASILALLVDPVAVEVDGTTLVADALSGGHPLVWVHGPVGGAGAALAAAACRVLDVPCLAADLHRLPPDADPGTATRRLLLEAGLSGAVLALVGAESVPQSVLNHAAVPVIAVSAELWDPHRADLPPTVTAPRLTLAQRERIWGTVLGHGQVDREVSALRLAPEQIVAVGRHARRMAELNGEPAVGLDRIRNSARLLGRGRGVRAQDVAATIDDLVLPAHALDNIGRLLDWARYRDEVIALGPLHGRGGKGTGICALFAGPPGTGKTLAAHVIADSLAMDLYQVELSGVIDKYVGETEKNLERVFVDAEAMNAVLFFDEADALFGSRSEVRDARDRYANQEIAYLLQRMEQFDGITVLASNLRGNIDPAFARRLHFIINFPEPDEATRARLWEHHLRGVGTTDEHDPIDVAGLARTVELAGGDIRNIVLSAAYSAVAAGERVGMRHIAAAARREYIKLGRRVPERIDADHTRVASSRAR